MRALPARRIASSAFCVTLLLGIAGPAAVAADHDSARDARASAAQAPVPGADTLAPPVGALGLLGGVLKPVTDLLDSVLKADKGRLPADDATKLADAVKKAIAKASATNPTTLPAAVPATPTLQRPKADGRPAVKAPADLRADALAALQKSVDALVKEAKSGNAASVDKAAPAVVQDLVNVVAATVLGGGTPAPNLEGLPALSRTSRTGSGG
ncbi:hypothetical protein G5C60_29805 [Streptomyces sp. HC44]|uniref:Secreted protein n=1 Tax=Streptomyces scabichelini TaxID=2711217 RepID=A0A6G4VC16_9ACTN|nr:hypothetical protein [Streptomyces scabichelini]NGO11678.1 hypothetical protein [Streptomyces scabichelini]